MIDERQHDAKMNVRRWKKLFGVSAALVALMASGPVYADCTSPASPEGGLNYVSTSDKFELCDGTNWLDITNGSSISAAGSDREIQFNSGNSLGADTNFVYTSTGDFIVGSYQLDDTGTGNEDNRMFFDKSKGAFRAGTMINSDWDDANVGNQSIALGSGLKASGNRAVALGEGNTASGNNSTAMGQNMTASGNWSTAMGYWNTASGNTSTAMGRGTVAAGDYSFTIGREAATTATGDYSFAFGLGDAAGTSPQVSGANSFGIFMGDQSGVDVTDANTVSYMGASGGFGIGTVTPATALDVVGAVKVDYDATSCDSTIQGAIRYDSSGSALDYCDGTSWQELAKTGSVSAAGSTTEIQYNSNGSLWADSNFVYNSVGDFIVGSYQLDDTGTGSEDKRVFFDRSKAAFRAGFVMTTQWDDANVGDYSAAFGLNTTASSTGSTAFGSGSVASNLYSFAVNGTASGISSVAMGTSNTASGANSLALGAEIKATANYSMALGLSNQSNTDGDRPVVSGEGSLGVFMDTVDTYDLSATDTFGIIGGELMIDEDGTSAASKGCIKFDDTTDKLQYSHDCSTYSDLGSATVTPYGSDTQIQYNSNGNLWGNANFVYTSTGNLGIGTASPGAALHISDGNADGEYGAIIDINHQNGEYFKLVNEADIDIMTIDSWNGQVALKVYAEGGAHMAGLYGFSGENAAVFARGMSDKTGVVTSGIGSAIHLAGDNNEENGITFTDGPNANTVGAAIVMFDANGGNFGEGGLRFKTNDGTDGGAANRMTIDESGVIHFDGDDPANEEGCIKFDETTDKLRFSHDCSTYSDMGSASPYGSDTQIQYNSNGSLWSDSNFVYNSAGKLGIGTSSPSTPLHVIGGGAQGQYPVTIEQTHNDGEYINFVNNAGDSVMRLVGANGNPRFYITDEYLNERFRVTTDVAGGPVLHLFSPTNKTSGTSAWGQGLYIQSQNNEENGIAFGDGGFSVEVGAQINFYDTNGGVNGQGGLKFKTSNSTSGAQTRITLDQNGVMYFDGNDPAAEKGCIQFDETTDKLQYSHDCSTYSDIGSASPYGSDTQIQYNSNGSLWASSSFTYSSKGHLGLISGTSSIFVGQGAGINDDGTDNYNVALGRSALGAITSGPFNTGIGANALTSTSTGQNNTAVGTLSLATNTTGDDNTAIGRNAMRYNTEADGNTAVGKAALVNFATTNTGFTYNTAIGYDSLKGVSSSTDGERNTALGALAGDSITTGDDNILIGYNADLPTPTTNEYLNIGNLLYGDIGTTSTDPKIGAAKYCDETLTTCFTTGDVGNATAAGSDREIQFNSGNSLGAATNFVYTSAGDFIVGSHQLDDTGTGSEDYRMFFDRSKGAFRAGHVTGAEWDDINVGLYSIAMGQSSKASGVGSFAAGGTQVPGVLAGPVASGDYSTAIGSTDLTASGDYSIAIGTGMTTNGANSVAIGSTLSSSQANAVAIGSNIQVSGVQSIGLGNYVNISGLRSAALGLKGVSGTRPIVSGDYSYGIFMGTQSGVDFTPNYTMGLFGGRMVIDPNVPATNLVADVALDVTGAVKVDYDATACSSTIQGAIRYDSGGSQFDLCDGASWKTIATSSGGSKWTSGTGDDIYYNSGSPQVGIGLTTPTAALHVVGNDASVDDAPDAFYVLGGSGTSNGDGGRVYMKAGPAAGTGTGGRFVILGGNPAASTGTGGEVYIRGGENTSIAGTKGGNVLIEAGDSRTAPGGTTSIYGGGYTTSPTNTRSYLTLSGSWATTSGGVILSAGGITGTTTNSGNLTIKTQDTTLTSRNTGDISITAGDASGGSSTGGTITLTAGDTNNVAAADITLNPGSSTSSSDGNVILAPTHGYVGIGMTGPSVELDVTGDIEYTGTITDVSDRRLKTDITPLDRAAMAERLMQIDTYSFRMKDDEKGQIEFGVMAQELERLFPELVRTANDEIGTKSVNYVGLIAPMIEATKTLKDENDMLRAELDDVRRDIAGLKAHTGYGISKAEMSLLMLLGLLLGGLGMLVITRRKA